MTGYTKGECAARVQARCSATTLPRYNALFPGCPDRPLPAIIAHSFRELSYGEVGRISLRIGKQPRNVKDDAGDTGMMTSTSEEIRLRYLYRRLILQGKIKISLRSAL